MNRKILAGSIVGLSALTAVGGYFTGAAIERHQFQHRNDQTFVGQTDALSMDHKARVRVHIYNREADKRRFVTITEPNPNKAGKENPTGRRIYGQDNRDGRWASVEVCIIVDLANPEMPICNYRLEHNSRDLVARAIYAEAARRLNQAVLDAKTPLPGNY